MNSRVNSVVSKPYRALVTGASRGIGREIAIALSAQCEKLFIVARSKAELESLRGLLACPDVVIMAGDLMDPGFIRQLARQVAAQGGINLLVNNAGASEFVEFGEQSSDSIERLIGLNVTSTVRLTQAMLPSLRLSPGGPVSSQIINIGSSFSYIGYPGFAVYCATKYAVRGFTQALGRELAGTGISVRLFSPRATNTEINSDAVRAMNRDLGVREDDPAKVAEEFVRFCAGRAAEYRVGFPEKLFAVINQVFPGVVGGAIEKQLPRIRKAFQNS